MQMKESLRIREHSITQYSNDKKKKKKKENV